VYEEECTRGVYEEECTRGVYEEECTRGDDERSVREEMMREVYERR
jgi:hypothetical protein